MATSNRPNYYEILNCRVSDSIEDIKKSYQTLLLTHHPDKKQHQENSNQILVNCFERFQQIDEAWKMLRDPIQRKAYDAEILQQQFNTKPIVHEILSRNQFTFDADLGMYIHPCRCSGAYMLPNDCWAGDVDANKNKTCLTNNIDEDCDDDEIYIECDECSLVVQLLWPKKT